jgi:hypothetical protein
MKKFLAVLAIVGMSLLSSSALAGVTIRVENKDSKEYTAKAVCHGTKYDVKIGKGTTSVTIQGSSPCEVDLNGSKLTLSGGERVIIKNGKMSK